MISIHGVPAFQDNYIWVIANGELGTSATAAIVVDPGDATPVLQFLQQWKLQLTAIFITHRHRDHVDGVAALVNHTPVPVYGPDDENIDVVSHAAHDGQHIAPAHSLGEWFIMRVPGHTRGHVAYLSGSSLFCGDTLFGGGCGRIFDGSVQDLHASLKKIALLPTNTHVYCAHEYTVANLVFGAQVEPTNATLTARLQHARQMREQRIATVPSTLGDELATNVFLRCHVPAVQEAVSAHFAVALNEERLVFAALRRWKDQFKTMD